MINDILYRIQLQKTATKRKQDKHEIYKNDGTVHIRKTFCKSEIMIRNSGKVILLKKTHVITPSHRNETG